MGERTCKYCGKEAKSAAGLVHHIRLKHPNPSEEDEARATAEQIRNAGTSIEVKDLSSVAVVGKVKEPTLGDARFDPFAKFKTDEEHYHYRALNVRPHNLRMREAQGFTTIPGSEYGDLVLGKMDIGLYNSLQAKERKKAADMLAAPKREFEQVAEAGGVETFEEKPAGD